MEITGLGIIKSATLHRDRAGAYSSKGQLYTWGEKLEIPQLFQQESYSIKTLAFVGEYICLLTSEGYAYFYNKKASIQTSLDLQRTVDRKEIISITANQDFLCALCGTKQVFVIDRSLSVISMSVLKPGLIDDIGICNGFIYGVDSQSKTIYEWEYPAFKARVYGYDQSVSVMLASKSGQCMSSILIRETDIIAEYLMEIPAREKFMKSEPVYQKQNLNYTALARCLALVFNSRRDDAFSELIICANNQVLFNKAKALIRLADIFKSSNALFKRKALCKLKNAKMANNLNIQRIFSQFSIRDGRKQSRGSSKKLTSKINKQKYTKESIHALLSTGPKLRKKLREYKSPLIFQQRDLLNIFSSLRKKRLKQALGKINHFSEEYRKHLGLFDFSIKLLKTCNRISRGQYRSFFNILIQQKKGKPIVNLTEMKVRLYTKKKAFKQLFELKKSPVLPRRKKLSFCRVWEYTDKKSLIARVSKKRGKSIQKSSTSLKPWIPTSLAPNFNPPLVRVREPQKRFNYQNSIELQARQQTRRQQIMSWLQRSGYSPVRLPSSLLLLTEEDRMSVTVMGFCLMQAANRQQEHFWNQIRNNQEIVCCEIDKQIYS